MIKSYNFIIYYPKVQKPALIAQYFLDSLFQKSLFLQFKSLQIPLLKFELTCRWLNRDSLYLQKELHCISRLS